MMLDVNEFSSMNAESLGVVRLNMFMIKKLVMKDNKHTLMENGFEHITS
jgi:hypothetical protein